MISFPACTLTEYIELTYNNGYHGNDQMRLSNVNSSPPLIFQFDVWFEVLNLQFIITFSEQKQLRYNNTVRFCLYNSISFSVLTLSRNSNPDFGNQATEKVTPDLFFSLIFHYL